MTVDRRHNDMHDDRLIIPPFHRDYHRAPHGVHHSVTSSSMEK
jgi:hypothetical protein